MSVSRFPTESVAASVVGSSLTYMYKQKNFNKISTMQHFYLRLKSLYHFYKNAFTNVLKSFL